MYCHGECMCRMPYWLVVTRLCYTHSLVECSHVKAMLGQQEALDRIDYRANWSTKQVHLL